MRFDRTDRSCGISIDIGSGGRYKAFISGSEEALGPHEADSALRQGGKVVQDRLTTEKGEIQAVEDVRAVLRKHDREMV
jgi:hypothetical protein